jgi:hypothetical protein
VHRNIRSNFGMEELETRRRKIICRE